MKLDGRSYRLVKRSKGVVDRFDCSGCAFFEGQRISEKSPCKSEDCSIRYKCVAISTTKFFGLTIRKRLIYKETSLSRLLNIRKKEKMFWIQLPD